MNEHSLLTNSLLDVSELLFRQNTNFSKLANKHTVNEICDLPNKCGIFHILNEFQLAFCPLKLSETIWTSVWSNINQLISSSKPFNKCNNLHYKLQSTNDLDDGKIIYLSDLIMEYIYSNKKCKSIVTGLIELDNQARWYLKQFQNIAIFHQSYNIDTTEAKLTKEIYFHQCLKSYKDWLCSELFSKFTLVFINNTSTKNTPTINSEYKYIKLPKCIRKCTQVETDCPYFQPLNQNGGEPGFLCDSSHYHSGTVESILKSEQCITNRYCCTIFAYESRTELNKKRTKISKSESSRLLLFLFPFYAIPICEIFIYYYYYYYLE